MVCWKANLTPNELNFFGLTWAQEAVSPMTSLGLLLYYKELCLEV